MALNVYRENNIDGIISVVNNNIKTLYKIEIDGLVFDCNPSLKMLLDIIINSHEAMVVKSSSLHQLDRFYFLTIQGGQANQYIIDTINESNYPLCTEHTIGIGSGVTNFSVNSNTICEEEYLAIDQLDRLGNNCGDELQYAKAEKLFQRAADLAEEIDDLSRTIKERYLLATMQRMQGKIQVALSIFTWLIEVAYSPDLSRKLGESDMYYIEGGFRNFVEIGRFLPDMQVTDLEKVLERGLDWLSTIGKSFWSAGLRLQRGRLWQQQGKFEEALAEMKIALELNRRNLSAPSNTLATSILNVADLLQEMEKLTEAEKYYRQITDSNEFNDGEKQWAWKGLAQISIEQSEWQTAEQRALKSLELARGIESPQPMMEAYNVLGDVYWKQDRIKPAITAKIQAWHYARQSKVERDLYNLYLDLAEIRLYQTRQSNPTRYIPKAQQWLHRALPLAIRLDNQVNSTDRQTKIRDLQNQCSELGSDR
jgi:tetratricopeptide (TPR) repeat protein